MAYVNKLYKVYNDHLKDKEIIKRNKSKSFLYGYDKYTDCVIIGHSGTLGDIYEVQGLRIGLPKTPKKVTNDKDVFQRDKRPATLDKIKSIYDFHGYPEDTKELYGEYIEEVWNKRIEGHWFVNRDVDTYITGSHYFYLNWAKIDVGAPQYRDANRIFYYFWEACKADTRCYGMCYLKNRRSGFSFMAASETVHQATQSRNSRFGILSKTGADSKKLFTDKVVPMSMSLPFFFKPIQSGMERPKTELAYSVPSRKLTRKSIRETTIDDEFAGEGLDTTIDWKNTGDNSYDGEKLKLLVHDESGKWEKPDNIINNWRVTKTCLRLGSRVVGKCMMGSTSNALDKGGSNFKKVYYDSDLTTAKRNRSGQTPSGLYALFIPMEWNYEGSFDKYGFPVFDTPEKPIDSNDGGFIDIGVIDTWQNEIDGLKDAQDSDAVNEHYRQFPRSEKHAFRDEAKNALFNLTKIYDQIAYNDEIEMKGYINRGSFIWSGVPYESEVEFRPNQDGRFYLSWMPPKEFQNNMEMRNGRRCPGNELFGSFGCDPYDISGTVGGGGSNGSLHGLTTPNMHPSIPKNMFFLEYVARPQTSEIFFDDVLKACIFYGMPCLIENNKARLLYWFKTHGYRAYSMNRPDKIWADLSVSEKELGGIPNTSQDVLQSHAGAIESYIEKHVGYNDLEQIGKMYFNRTLQDWARFDITKRTHHDESISSGLAIMAVQKHMYRPNAPVTKTTIDFAPARYNQKGNSSVIIKQNN